MIARLWRGRTPASSAEAYLDYLRETGVRACRSTAGNRGVYVFRRQQGSTSEFLFVSLWDSLDAVRRFAGEEPEKAVYYPEDEHYLLELEPHVVHYDVLEAPRTG